MLHRVAVALASLRWRLTLMFVGLLAVLLAGLGTYEYFALRGSLIANRVAALQDDYNSARVIITRLPAATAPRGRQLCARAPTLVGRSVAQVVAATSGQAVGVVVYDPSLAIAATVPAGADLPHLDSAALRAVVSTGRRSGAEVIATSGDGALVVGFPITIAGTVCGVTQMSTPMTPITNVLRDELVLVGLGGGAALLVALVIGLLLTGRALRPLHRLSATAEQLAAGDLRARSRLIPRSDEVGALAQSFDNMADRIEESFAAQQESEAQVRRFIADASHELRTPVTALKGYIDVLRRGAGRDPEALDAALEAMGSEADRMRALVLDLLTLARIDARRETHLEDVDLSDAVGSALDEGVPGMPAVLERHFTSAPLIVRADRGSLATIVRNLLVNACKYAPGAPQRWSTAVDGVRARLDVHDDGPGIPALDLPHIFERFYRGEKTRAREEGGSGLGLSIVQGLARAQGGDVAVYSAEGMGTTVSVWLPLGR
ncbi:MAG TPA: HAMP domain-containing sensor histidine kinase [Candidatus Acidoferrales bacterium]|nr:HAMP domain-containing sensor histidine kinase [Candidatus Acidoferrales bacterium]